MARTDDNGASQPTGGEAATASQREQELRALLARKNEQVAELRSKLLDTRRTLNERLEIARKEAREFRRALALHERRHKMTDVDALSHNSAASMDEYFVEVDEEPYVRFGSALRQELRRRGIGLSGRTVADAGVGPGIALKELLRGSEPAGVFGFDFSETALERARRELPQGAFERCGIYDLPNRKFDVLICTEVLEHLERPADAVRILSRMLTPDAHLVLTVPDGRIDFSEKHVNFWSPESWSLFVQQTLPDHEVETGIFCPYPETGHRTNLALIR